MNEVQHEEREFQASMGKAMLEYLCEIYDVEIQNDYHHTVESISRRVYKETECGAWLAVDEKGLSVGSIVEGVDYGTEIHTLSWYEFLKLEDPVRESLERWLDRALAEVEREAEEIWQNTHGCEKCGEEDEFGYRAIDPWCDGCRGQGVIL